MATAIARNVARSCPATVDPEDLEQTALTDLWQACAAYDPARAASFRAYLKMRIRGAVLDSVWAAKERRDREAARIDDEEAICQNCHNVAPGADPFVTRAVQRLGGRQAAVIGLRFYAGMSRPEAASAIGISLFAVARAERAAVRTLRKLLKAA